MLHAVKKTYRALCDNRHFLGHWGMTLSSVVKYGLRSVYATTLTSSDLLLPLETLDVGALASCKTPVVRSSGCSAL